MIIIMQPAAQEAAIQNVINHIRAAGLSEHVSVGAERVIIGAVGDERVLNAEKLENLPQVERAVRVVHDWRIISREADAKNSVYPCRGLRLGEGVLEIVLGDADGAMAFFDPFRLPDNPYQSAACDEEQTARALPSQFAAAHQAGRAVMVRVRDVRQLDAVLGAKADVVYLGGEWLESRLMQAEVGRLNMPVVVCKDKHHTLEQWLLAAERVAMHGNHRLILGEAGTLALNHRHPYRLDVEAVAEAVKYTHLPVLANVSRLPQDGLSQTQLSAMAAIAGASMVVRRP